MDSPYQEGYSVYRGITPAGMNTASAGHRASYAFRRSVEAVKEAVPLAEYAGRLVELKRNGELLVGLCPLPDHDERTPSFTVYPDGHWWCFGCHRGSDVLDLHQLAPWYDEKWEALVSLAIEWGVELPGRSDAWHASHERKRSVEDLAMRARGAVYKRRVFAILVEPVVSRMWPPERFPERYAEEHAETWRGFGQPEFWARAVENLFAGGR